MKKRPTRHIFLLIRVVCVPRNHSCCRRNIQNWRTCGCFSWRHFDLITCGFTSGFRLLHVPLLSIINASTWRPDILFLRDVHERNVRQSLRLRLGCSRRSDSGFALRLHVLRLVPQSRRQRRAAVTQSQQSEKRGETEMLRSGFHKWSFRCR